MDRTAIDGATPEPVAPSPSAPAADELPVRRPGEPDRVYRRPPAQEAAESAGMPAGWFGDARAGGGTAAPEAGAAVRPESGPATPAGTGRASFGFGTGPISGNRPLGEPEEPGTRAGGEADSGGLPIVRRQGPESAPTVPGAAASPSAFPGWAASAWGDGTDRAPAASAASWGGPADRDPAASPASWGGGADRDPAASPASWGGGADLIPVSSAAAASAAVPGGGRLPRRQSRVVTVGMTVLGVVAGLVIALTGVVFYAGPDSRVNQMLNLGGDGDRGAGPRTVTAPLDGRTRATFEMLAASDRVRVRVADIGNDLFRISTPDDSPLRPSPQLADDRVRLQMTRDGDGADGEVDVVLAISVRWSLRFAGYAAEREVDLGQGRVTGIEVVGGTRRAVMALSSASGTVPVKITGGIEELTLRAPADSPIRVRVGGGATTVTAGTRTLRDVAPGSTLTPKDWNTSGRYDVEAVAKLTLLSVEAG
ncbi:hypothetical protein [Actinoplanes teichomyceticus]|uniref:Uncharacterized protein n=1 Tax=Actinoplanes teichomyceticus TaxID=1867 RepID=A0A561VG45_ACTTI|nr:hypothetical protein [Actinoplanes teichomyceticus]TWG10577.1 hypothetical protein FHX34_10768 [Actinoplanes teichomyceticus]GIF15350.1 hypothetical protein Ate01nite_53820 [Actinoplanes teichomyceticus]